MERIKIQTTNALDRMSIMQKRYHEHQEALRSTSDLSRQPSNASQFDDSNVSSMADSTNYSFWSRFVLDFFCFYIYAFCSSIRYCSSRARVLCPSGKLTIEIHPRDRSVLAHAFDRAASLTTMRIDLKMVIWIVSIRNSLAAANSEIHKTMAPTHEHARWAHRYMICDTTPCVHSHRHHNSYRHLVILCPITIHM